MIRFEYRAWHILSICEKFVGSWPYQNKMKNLALRILNASIVLAFMVPLIFRLIEEWNKNLQIVVENFVVLVSVIILLIKIVTISTIDERRMAMFEKITTHLETIVDEDEAQILRSYSEKGLRFTIIAIILLASPIGIFLALPVIRMFYLHFFEDGLLEKRLPLYLALPFDEQKYFFYIVALMFSGLTYGTIVDFAFDLNFFLTVRHICALFEIVKFRLNKASDIFKHSDQNNKLPDEDEAKAHEIISSAVDLHNEASQLNESLDEAYKLSWFFILLLNAVSLAPTPVMAMLFKDDSFELFRRSMALIVYPAHFYIIFVQGQMITDYSESVFDSCYDFYWYNASKRCQVAISITMIRSLQPNRLTGVLFDLSMETYSVMLKTALSYISIFQALDM